MKFSLCGKFLATAGKDQLLKVWVLKSFYAHFVDQFKRHNLDSKFIQINLHFFKTFSVNDINFRSNRCEF